MIFNTSNKYIKVQFYNGKYQVLTNRNPITKVVGTNFNPLLTFTTREDMLLCTIGWFTIEWLPKAVIPDTVKYSGLANGQLDPKKKCG